MVASWAVTVDPRTRLRAVPSPVEVVRRYEPQGGARDLFFCTDKEVLLEGPAGTGKSLACLKKLDRNAVKYPGSRQLIVRKTRTSLTQTALITFEKQVIVAGGRVRFHTTRQAYLYPNGSEIVVGGLDKDSKVMSSEYDAIYVQEATELTEADWEALTTRLRNGVIPHQQLIADCNPDA
ncbi:MAG TPA: phage terminase large subunit, partial [Thermomicrobiales bacterium]|nr:phage terminase large subunit [Thermomicrobiales bacterium]